MESLTGAYEGNTVARAVARRIIERANEVNEEEGIDEEGDDVDTDDEADEELGFDADEEDNNSYDSDDPRSFGGEYYWDQAGTNSSSHSDAPNVSVRRMCSDNVRLCVFYILRTLGFLFMVFQHFFGLNRSRFQWAVDLVEQERVRRDEQVLSGSLPASSLKRPPKRHQSRQ